MTSCKIPKLLALLLLASSSAYAQAPSSFSGLSTRGHVSTADDVLISGAILLGPGGANIVVRALGPSLTAVSGPLGDPVLELRDMNGELIAINDNWKDTQRTAIEATGQQPPNDLESAIFAPLAAGAYTAIVHGQSNTTGLARVEMIDLDVSSEPNFTRLSTRARASSGDSTIVAGFTIGGLGSRKVLIRGHGPSLGMQGIVAPLENPALRLRDSGGKVLVFNNNWKDTQQAEVQATNFAPSHDLESAIVATLPPGSYTAELEGVCGGSGPAIIDLHDLGAGTSSAIPGSSHLLACGPAAPSVVVTNTADNGPGSLRNAIATVPSGGTIGFSKTAAGGAVNFYDGLPHTITLTSGVLTLDKSLAIAGPNPNLLTISGNQASRVFLVNSGVSVTIDNLKVANGAVASPSHDFGGGILNAGTLTISNCVITKCSIAGPSAGSSAFVLIEGGGISNSGTLSIVDSSVIENAVSGGSINRGGGIGNRSGSMTINGSTIANNSVTAPGGSSASGGGISNETGTVTITGSLIADNTCAGTPGAAPPSGGAGGAILNIGALTITDTMISGNTVTTAGSAAGGGISSSGQATLKITRSAIHANSLNGGSDATGGAIRTTNDLIVVDSTISNNTAKQGGGIYFASGSRLLTITNSTIAANTASGASNAQGGGIYNNFGRAHLTGVTVSGNVASVEEPNSAGGGIYTPALPGNPPPFRLQNTIVASNTGRTPDISGSITSLGRNLIGNTTGTNITGDTTTNLLNVDAKLDRLRRTGGVTATMLPLPGSPAIDAGGDFTILASAIDASTTSINVADATSLPAGVGFVIRIDAEQMIVTGSTGNTLTVTRAANGSAAVPHGEGAAVNPAFDQRGHPRKAGARIDIGAVETAYALSITSSTAQSTAVGSAFGSGFQLQLTENEQPLAGISVTFTAPAAGASGTFAGGSHSVTVVTDANGFATTPAFIANTKAGSYAVIVTFSGSGSSITYQLTNQPGPVARFNVTAPADVNAGSPFQVDVLAVDAFDNAVSAYNGTVRFTSSDARADLPPNTAHTNGIGSFTVVLRAGGNQTVTVSDTVTSATGTSAAINVRSNELLNIATRMKVLTGENVLIAGFIVTGTDAKKIIVRGIGPSVAVGNALSDPVLQLFDADGNVIASNDDWKVASDGASQQAEIEATGIAPQDEREPALIATVPSSGASYTAMLSGKGGNTGVGLVEVYDLNNAANSKLANISTRGFVDTGDDVMIGGIIVGGPNTGAGTRVIVRAIGPSLPVDGNLADPLLELYDGNGAILASNDDWQETQRAEIEATGVAPADEKEAAIVRTLSAGNYTAIVSGANGTTGIGLVEGYNLGH